MLYVFTFLVLDEVLKKLYLPNKRPLIKFLLLLEHTAAKSPGAGEVYCSPLSQPLQLSSYVKHDGLWCHGRVKWIIVSEDDGFARRVNIDNIKIDICIFLL